MNEYSANKIEKGLRTQCVVEGLFQGRRISRIEAMVLFAIPNLTSVISQLRKRGLTIHSAPVPYADILQRINKFALLQPPNQLPINELVMNEYWLDEKYLNEIVDECDQKVKRIFGDKNNGK